MPYLSSILARVLAFGDFLLSKWVDVGFYPSTTSNCWTFYVAEANVNTCGQEFINNLVEIVEGVVGLVPSVLGGLFATPA
jgi:hypothetical protein